MKNQLKNEKQREKERARGELVSIRIFIFNKNAQVLTSSKRRISIIF